MRKKRIEQFADDEDGSNLPPSISSMIKLFLCPRRQLQRQISPVLQFAGTCYSMTVHPRPLAQSIAEA